MNKNGFFTFAPLVALGLSLVFSLAGTPGKSYLSVPAAAFQRQRETFPYYLDAKEIYNPTGGSATLLLYYYQMV